MTDVMTRLRAEIHAYCLRSMEYGLNFNTQGNISVRLPGSAEFLITPTDLEYDKMAPADVVWVDGDGRRLAGELEPSSEVTVHAEVYRRRPDVQAIVHTEPIFANVFGVAGTPIRCALINMAIYSKGDVPIMPFHPSNSREFGSLMCDVMGEKNAVVWANHGLLTVGESLREAFKTSVAVESAAKVLVHAAALTNDPIVLDYESLGIDHAL